MAKVFFGSDAAGAFVAARRFCKPASKCLSVGSLIRILPPLTMGRFTVIG